MATALIHTMIRVLDEQRSLAFYRALGFSEIGRQRVGGDTATVIFLIGSLMCGLAGALRIEHLPRLATLAPDFAGFRTAVCHGDRGGALDPRRLRALHQAASGGRDAPISRARTESSALL